MLHIVRCDFDRPKTSAQRAQKVLQKISKEWGRGLTVKEYRKALGEMANPMTRFLLQMIVSDEEKHRAVIHAMVATLKGSLTWTKPAGSLEGMSDVADVNGRLRAATEEMIGIEKEGIKDYKLLIEQSSGYYQGLFKILLESMMRDTEKHVQLLEFLKEQLKSA